MVPRQGQKGSSGGKARIRVKRRRRKKRTGKNGANDLQRDEEGDESTADTEIIQQRSEFVTKNLWE